VLRKASRHVIQKLENARLTELELFNGRDKIGTTPSCNNSPQYKHDFEREPA
jgi:hypothetical protein